MVRANSLNSVAQQTVYVNAQTGSNTLGNGSAMNPWATLTFAYTQITLNTASQTYAIYATGIFNESVAVKPFTGIVGAGNETTVINGTLTLDTSWTGLTGTFSLVDLYIQKIDFDNSAITAVVLLDWNGVVQGQGVSGQDVSLVAGENESFLLVQNSIFNGEFVISDYPLQAVSTLFAGFTYDQPNGVGIDGIEILNCAFLGDIPSFSRTSGSGVLIADTHNTTMGGTLTVNSGVVYQYDAVSYPSIGGFTFGGTGLARCYTSCPNNVPQKTITGATYTALLSDYVLFCNRAGTIGITLPTPSSVIGKNNTLIIKDISGAAASNNITLTPAAGTIEGSSTYVINVNYGSARIQFDGTNWWIV